MRSAETAAFSTSLEQWWLRGAHAWRMSRAVAFRGGWVVFLGYELAREIEPRLDAAAGRSALAGLRAANAVRGHS